jgi:hypothetical protein
MVTGSQKSGLLFFLIVVLELGYAIEDGGPVNAADVVGAMRVAANAPIL